MFHLITKYIAHSLKFLYTLFLCYFVGEYLVNEFSIANLNPGLTLKYYGLILNMPLEAFETIVGHTYRKSWLFMMLFERVCLGFAFLLPFYSSCRYLARAPIKREREVLDL